jgi:acetolactate synthase-1/2/3 large subunit
VPLETKEKATASQILVRSLVTQGVTHIFGIPGGKIMPVFDALNDSPRGLELVVCRHEQNAAFMAAAVGRLTGRPGVCLVTSGPGTSNLVTGAATATSEGDPMIAIGGVVPLKQVHQTMDSVAVMKPVTKYSAAIATADATGEVVANAFRASMAPRAGAAFIAFPQDVQGELTEEREIGKVTVPTLGPAPDDLVKLAALRLAAAQTPVVLLGMGASEPNAVEAVRELLRAFPIPAVGTFQGAGVISRDLVSLFFGRIGLFRNQPGDRLLANADVVLTIGYDPVEYGPEAWNVSQRAAIIHLDDAPCELANRYQPEIELYGSVQATVARLTELLSKRQLILTEDLKLLQTEWHALQRRSEPVRGPLVQPLDFVLTLRSLVDDDTIIASDMGSHHIWMARHFFEYEPRRLLFSNGQQTLGVGIPWAMAASFLNPGKKVVATVGDGGFLYSSMELETAVRHKLNMTVFVFRDGSYNMVAFQQELQFGRTSGVQFGNPDIVQYAESLGCTGMRIDRSEQMELIVRKALDTPGVVIVDMPVDYSKNVELGQHVLPNASN